MGQLFLIFGVLTALNIGLGVLVTENIEENAAPKEGDVKIEAINPPDSVDTDTNEEDDGTKSSQD